MQWVVFYECNLPPWCSQMKTSSALCVLCWAKNLRFYSFALKGSVQEANLDNCPEVLKLFIAATHLNSHGGNALWPRMPCGKATRHCGPQCCQQSESHSGATWKLQGILGREGFGVAPAPWPTKNQVATRSLGTAAIAYCMIGVWVANVKSLALQA